MKIQFSNKNAEELANLLCEVDALIEDGTIPIGITGISENATKMCKLFYRGTSDLPSSTEIIFTDSGLKL